jgi:creatinine amidohydrolase/Fe(II)-dependent formamide hydrolase-like protein
MELRWDRLTWQEFAHLQSKGYKSAILPIGTIEAHGVIPLGTDSIIPETIAARIAGDCKSLIAPTISYGITRSLVDYPGSLSASPTGFKNYVTDIFNSMAGKGMERLIILNGHGGQNDELREAAFEVFEKTGIKIAVIHWWILCADLVPIFFNTEGGHAAVDETAAMIACAPQTIKKDFYNPDMLYHVKNGANIYPIPSTILVYKENTGALDFDAAKANSYFEAVCRRVKEFVLDTFRRWDGK